MSLTLYYHPLASFCWKALIALYEGNVPFTPRLVDLGDPADRRAFERVWPLAKFPVLRDERRGKTIPESTVIIEYLAQNYPSAAGLIPQDPDLAREARLRDRIFDHYVHEPMQKIVLDRLRPGDSRDALGVAQARAGLRQAYDLIEGDLGGKTWSVGDAFTLADCAAFPALHYARLNEPFGARHERLAAYLERLAARPSIARTLEEAQPYFSMYPAG